MSKYEEVRSLLLTFGHTDPAALDKLAHIIVECCDRPRAPVFPERGYYIRFLKTGPVQQYYEPDERKWYPIAEPIYFGLAPAPAAPCLGIP